MGIIDTRTSAYKKFPASLNGEVLLDPDTKAGYLTAPLAACYAASKLTVQDRINSGWSKYEVLLAGLDYSSLSLASKLSSMQAQKISEINVAHKIAENAPVVFLGVTYSGGRSSAQAINESLMLSEMASITTVDVYDVANDPQSLTITKAKTLILKIAKASKINLFNLNAKVKAANAATTQTELNGVVW